MTQERQPTESSKARLLKIMVVDDSLVYRKLICDLLAEIDLLREDVLPERGSLRRLP